MNRLEHKRSNKIIRKNRVRGAISGTAARPRMTIHISNRNVSAQIIDDIAGTTLASATTVQDTKTDGTMTDLCAHIGEAIAKKAKKAKVTKVVLDRNGRSYQKRLNAFATAARENGLEF